MISFLSEIPNVFADPNLITVLSSMGIAVSLGILGYMAIYKYGTGYRVGFFDGFIKNQVKAVEKSVTPEPSTPNAVIQPPAVVPSIPVHLTEEVTIDAELDPEVINWQVTPKTVVRPVSKPVKITDVKTGQSRTSKVSVASSFKSYASNSVK